MSKRRASFSMFQQHEDPRPLHRQQEPPSSPSSAKHLISAPPHAPALHHLSDVPLSLPDLAPYSEPHGLQAGHLLPDTFNALTVPLYGGAPSDLFLPGSTTLASRLPTDDHLFTGLLPPVSGLNFTNGQLGTSPQAPSGQQGSDQLIGSRVLKASFESSQDGPSHKAPAAAQVRDTKRRRDAGNGPLPGQAPPVQQRRGEHQRGIANSPSRPLPSRPPLRSANVTARAPQDAESGTDTDGDDDVLQRVRRARTVGLNVTTLLSVRLMLPWDYNSP